MDVKHASSKQINSVMGRMVEHQSIFNKMSVVDAQWAFQNPNAWMHLCLEAMKKRKTVDVIFETEYLNLISDGETLIIDKCDGKRIISDATEIISYVDSDFRNWKADQVGQATPDMLVSVFEQTKDGTYADIFGSILNEKDRLCLTQDQIIGFVVKYRHWLRTDGYGTFFMFKSNGNHFVARVSFDSDGTLRVRVHELGRDSRWSAEFPPRFVVPQLVA